MTRQENILTLNEHLDHWKRLLSEKICDQSEGEKTIDALQNAIKALEQQSCEDCVSRQAVIELCEGWWLGHTKEDDFATEIRALPSVNPQKSSWIPVSERLPEEAGMYLCSYDDDDVGTSYFDIRMNEFNVLHEQVTAWMYIAEPYQPEIPTGAEGSEE